MHFYPFKCFVLCTISVFVLIASGAQDAEVFDQLTPEERQQWTQAKALLEKGNSDIKTGEWYLRRTVSHEREKASIAQAHEAGKRIKEAGEKNVLAANQTLDALRETALARLKAIREAGATAVRYSEDLVSDIDPSSLVDSLADWIYNMPIELGYQRVNFDGLFHAGLAKAELDADLTEEIRKKLIMLDGTRFQVRQTGSISLKDDALFFEDEALLKKDALVFGLIYPTSVDDSTTRLISVHIVDSVTWQLKNMINVLDSKDPRKAPSQLVLEDTSDFFEKLADHREVYDFRVNYAFQNLKALDHGSWIPAAFKKLALTQNLAEIIDSDYISYLYGDTSNASQVRNARGNATFRLGINDDVSDQILLTSKADRSNTLIEVGTLDIRFSPMN